MWAHRLPSHIMFVLFLILAAPVLAAWQDDVSSEVCGCASGCAVQEAFLDQEFDVPVNGTSGAYAMLLAVRDVFLDGSNVVLDPCPMSGEFATIISNGIIQVVYPSACTMNLTDNAQTAVLALVMNSSGTFTLSKQPLGVPNFGAVQGFERLTLNAHLQDCAAPEEFSYCGVNFTCMGNGVYNSSVPCNGFYNDVPTGCRGDPLFAPFPTPDPPPTTIVIVSAVLGGVLVAGAIAAFSGAPPNVPLKPPEHRRKRSRLGMLA
jgi:hypothetical protein